MNAQPSPKPPFRAVWPADLAAFPTADNWLWTGYLAPGAITLLTGPWKAGKTTLTAALLARLRTGGMFAGRPLGAGKAIVVSEENEQQWRNRRLKFDFGDHLCFICRPFRTKPRPAQWHALLDCILQLHAKHAFALAVFDPLAELLPCKSENDAGLMLEALLPLRDLTEAGLAVLLSHHPRKQASAEGQGARGSGALSGHGDILIEMSYFRRASAADRRRKLLAYSRFEGTPRQAVIQLNEAGTDYAVLGDLAEEEFARNWGPLADALAQATQPLTQRQLRADWAVEQSKRPSQPTLSRWLDRAVATGRVQREGTGRSNDPFRYWLQGQQEQWAQQKQTADDAEWQRLRHLFGDEWVEQERHRRAAEK